jgi:putative photosynthetic complex assembly protein 2
MSLYVHAVLFALFVWYFSTGAILYLDGLPPRTFRWSMAVATVVLGVAMHGLALSSADTTPTGVYLAFTYGVLAWAWQEMAFLMGFLTGPRRAACAHGCSGWAHFGHAIGAVLYHELAIVAGAALVLATTWGGANQTGLWTFMILWGMRESAKLNVFLGVRNLSLEFLPPHMEFIKGYLTKKPMNLLFPVSVTVSSAIAVVLVQRAGAAETHFAATGYVFLATMMILAIAEHWFLVLPLPFSQLWSWGLRSHRAAARPVAFRVIEGGAAPAALPARTVQPTVAS